MTSRRRFGALSLASAAPEIAFVQHAAGQGGVRADTVWLNANENPEGPPPEAKEAISRAISEAGRYNHRAFPALHEALAHLAGVENGQVMPGAGSTEVLHCALDAFTSASKPLITSWPTWEMARDVVEPPAAAS
jgi:histidinol-phosphate/aromatic aminotransferase/cobyric acid decarboxylase-like protein